MMMNGKRKSFLSLWLSMRAQQAASAARSMVTSGAFHLSELTSQTIPVAMRISFLINSPTRSVKFQNVCTKEMVFQQKLLEKAYFIFKLTGRAMVGAASSDKWNAPLQSLTLPFLGEGVAFRSCGVTNSATWTGVLPIDGVCLLTIT